MSAFSDSIRRIPAPLALLLLAAIVVRISYLLIYAGLPDWSMLTVDNYYHLNWANEIANGNFLGDTTYFRAPFYIYCLAILNSFFGESLWVARIFGLVIGLGAIIMTYLITRRLFSERAAIMAASIQALFPIVLYFESEILLDALFMFLLEFSFYRFLIWRENDSKRNLVWLALTVGLAAITRPIALVFAPLLLVSLFLNKTEIRRRLSQAILFGGAVLVLILPITARNLFVGHEPVLIAAQGGINFYIGNHNNADGLSAVLPEPLGHNWQIKDITYIAEKETGRALNPGGVSSYWYGRTLDEILSDPISWLSLFVKKIYFSISNREISNNRNLTDFFERHPMLNFSPLSFALIFALAVLAVSSGWQSHSGSRIIVLIIVIYILSIALFFFNSRFRLPLLPFYFILAAAGAETLYLMIRHRPKSLLNPLLVGSGAFLISFLPLFALPGGVASQHLITRGLKLYAESDFNAALEVFEQAAAADSTFPETNLNIGACYFRLGQSDSGLYYFEKERRLHPQRASSYTNIASIEFLNGNYEKAIAEADRAIALKPYFLIPHLIKLKAAAGVKQIDSTQFYQLALESIKLTGSDPKVANTAAIILSERGHYQKARHFLELAVRTKPVPIEIDDNAFTLGFARSQIDFNSELAKAHYQLGFVLGMEKEFGLSVKESRTAIELDSTLAEAYPNLANGLQALGMYERADSVMTAMRRKFPNHDYFRDK